VSTNNPNQIQKTVFIVGAGASKEVNLPVGSELKDTIAYALDFDLDSGYLTGGDKIIFSVFPIVARSNNPPLSNFDHFLRAAWQIRDAMLIPPCFPVWLYAWNVARP
jgi:hypothetical protein